MFLTWEGFNMQRVTICMMLVVLLISTKANAEILNDSNEYGFSTQVTYVKKLHTAQYHNFYGRLFLYHKMWEKHWEGLISGTQRYRVNENKYSLVIFCNLNSKNDKFELDGNAPIICAVGNSRYTLNKKDFSLYRDKMYMAKVVDMDYRCISAIIHGIGKYPIVFYIPVKNNSPIVYIPYDDELQEWIEGMGTFIRDVANAER